MSEKKWKAARMSVRQAAQEQPWPTRTNKNEGKERRHRYEYRELPMRGRIAYHYAHAPSRRIVQLRRNDRRIQAERTGVRLGGMEE